MAESKSIFYYIMENLVEDEEGAGYLPESFRLPQDDLVGMSKLYVDGAMDGMYVYHVNHDDAPKEVLKKLDKALSLAVKGRYEEAEAKLSLIGRKCRAVTLIDAFEEVLYKYSKKDFGRELIMFALDLITKSSDRECVKFGLMIFEAFEFDHEELRDLVSMLGLSDEFTLFSIIVMSYWKDGNECIFDLAKRVHGWGRIHAVCALDADTPEKKEWLLLHGIENNIMPQYSALDCYRKAEVEEKIKGEITKDELSAIGRILTALCDEGPVLGISAVENRGMLLDDYERQCEKFGVSEGADTVTNGYYTDPASYEEMEEDVSEDSYDDEDDTETSEEGEALKQELYAYLERLKDEDMRVLKQWEDDTPDD